MPADGFSLLSVKTYDCRNLVADLLGSENDNFRHQRHHFVLQTQKGKHIID